MSTKTTQKLLGFCSAYLLAGVHVALGACNQDAESFVEQAACRLMQRSTLYAEIQRIRGAASPGSNVLLLEYGNYAWGGYDATLLIDNADGAVVYCTQRKPDHAIASRRLAPDLVHDFWNGLINELGLQELESNTEFPCYDCSTAFFEWRYDYYPRRIVVYAPHDRPRFRQVASRIKSLTGIGVGGRRHNHELERTAPSLRERMRYFDRAAASAPIQVPPLNSTLGRPDRAIGRILT